MIEHKFIEKSLNGYPGKISAIVSLSKKRNFLKNFDSIKKNLLKNPMVTAILLEEIDSKPAWENFFKIAEWAKNNNLNIGVHTKKGDLENLKSALSNNFLDFVRISAHADKLDNKRIENLKKALAKVRTGETKYEFCLNVDKNTEIEKIKELYKSFSPCNNFVICCNDKLKGGEREKFIDLTRETRNIILRFWD